MIIGTGIDIINNLRIKILLEKFGFRLLNKIFSAREIEILSNKFSLDNFQQAKLINFIAKRFAGKEAFAKATGFGIGSVFAFRDIEIINDNFGKPNIFLASDKQNLFTNKFDLVNIHLSLSDEKEYSVAVVIIEKI
jgi:holo-[acyl-carrier protein] synthase